MAKKAQRTPEQLREDNLKSNVADMDRAVEMGLIPTNPTRRFELGERVHVGNHDEVYIHEICANGLYYICKALQVKRDRYAPPVDEFHVQAWHEIYKYKQVLDTDFAKEEKYYIRHLNSGIDSLFHMVYAPHAGVDFDVEYQREHVWELEDKVALIDSVFNNVDIGKITFVQLREDTKGRYYQVLDGKQRLTALCEFYEDRFPYKGVYFSQLSWKDKNKFRSHGITYGFLENPSKEAIYASFIKLNTCGKPMDHKHIEKVRNLLNDLDSGK